MSRTWNRGKLGDVCRVIPGYAFKSSDWQDSGIPVVKIKNIRGDNTVDLSEIDCVPESLLTPKLQKFLLRDGDILVAMTGATAGKVGKVRTNRSILLNQRVAKILPVDADTGFIWAVVSSDEYQEKFFHLADGAAQPNMSGSQIEGIEIPLPPLPVQRRIAGILSAYDELIENNQRRIKILEEMARSLYREWFVHFRFPGHDKVKMVPSPLGPIPQGWEVKTIQQFGQVIIGKTPSKANPNFYGKDMPFVKTPDMHGNMFVLETGERLSTAGAESQANKTIPPGSICVSCIGTIGIVSLTTKDCQTNQQINSVVLSDGVAREFLFLRLQDLKQKLENLGSTGATMGNVNKGKFESIEIVASPMLLLEGYHRLVAPIFSEMLNLSQRFVNLRRTRDLLLPRLLSGQIALADGGS